MSTSMRVILCAVLLQLSPLGLSQDQLGQPFKQERFVESLKAKQIIQILKTGVWKTPQQTISSKETNNDKNPEPSVEKLKAGDNASGVEAFSDLQFEPDVKRILDVGGGKYNVAHDFMKKRNIDLLVWDPYNRSAEHNSMIQIQVMEQPVDAATSMAVLNVIPEPEARLAHINTLKAALKMNGLAYFKIWPGEGTLKGSYEPTVNSYGFPGFQANSYPDRFLREVQIVFGSENAEISKILPNLIIARKKYAGSTSEQEIRRIQRISAKDEWHSRRTRYLKSTTH